MGIYHLLGANLSLLVLACDQSRAGHDRGTNGGRRAESGPRKRTENAGVHVGLSGHGGSARCGGDSIGEEELEIGGETYGTRSGGPGEMEGDGVAGGRAVVLLDVSSAKARSLPIT